MNHAVDFYFHKAQSWQQEQMKLRTILLGCGLQEELKWGCPCYTLALDDAKKTNVVLIHAFKEYCALLFFKGALLKDEAGILVQQTKNVQSARQLRFTSLREVKKLEPVIKAYVQEAIEVEKAGLKVKFTAATELEFPPEFKSRLAGDPALKKAFQALTPGRQRAYNLYFTGAKQTQTRASRVEKCIPQILDGKGLHD